MTNLRDFLTPEENESLKQLYARRKELERAISSLEQLESLRLRRMREHGPLLPHSLRVA